MVTFIVPTVGRTTLRRTLESIECWPGDEILLVGDGVYSHDPRCRHILCKKGGDWGHTERNHATKFVQKGHYIAHIDDDDWYAPGTRALMADAIHTTPNRPVLFRMQYPNGITLWQSKEVLCGNVGTPMILIPNEPEKLGRFLPFVGGDWAYLNDSKWEKSEFVWRPEIIAYLDRNTDQPPRGL